MFGLNNTPAMKEQIQGILSAVLMYRLGVNEVTITMDDVAAVMHTFNATALDLMVKPDHENQTVSFKIVASNS